MPSLIENRKGYENIMASVLLCRGAENCISDKLFVLHNVKMCYHTMEELFVPDGCVLSSVSGEKVRVDVSKESREGTSSVITAEKGSNDLSNTEADGIKKSYEADNNGDMASDKTIGTFGESTKAITSGKEALELTAGKGVFWNGLPCEQILKDDGAFYNLLTGDNIINMNGRDDDRSPADDFDSEEVSAVGFEWVLTAAEAMKRQKKYVSREGGACV